MKESSVKRRIFELDLLRGIFIAIIFIDHLQFWPSPLRYVTGEGRLWVSAAEGFFLISGLLIGYIRAYKGKKYPLKDLSIKLWKRAGMLYVWGVIVTIYIVLFSLWVGGPQVHPLLPRLPDPSQLSSPFTFIVSVITTSFFADWIYFLRLYAIMLAVTPLFLWLVRRKKDWIIILLMIISFALSFLWPEGALQWQVLFFGAALIGYRLESIAAWLRKRPIIKYSLTWTAILITIITMIISYFFVLGWPLVERPENAVMTREQYISLRTVIDPWFTSSPMSIGRLILSFIWFSAMLLFLHALRPFIMRWFGWLLIPMGERSLSYYILQALLLPIVVTFLQPSTIPIINAAIAIGLLLGMWALLKIPILSRNIPR